MFGPGSGTIRTLAAALPELAAEARARSLEFEERRELVPDFTDKFRRGGAFRILVPPDAVGLGGALSQWLEIIMTLAEADASTGWVTAHANICARLIYASADRQFRDEFFSDPTACAASRSWRICASRCGSPRSRQHKEKRKSSAAPTTLPARAPCITRNAAAPVARGRLPDTPRFGESGFL